jgi:hypothetical protein
LSRRIGDLLQQRVGAIGYVGFLGTSCRLNLFVEINKKEEFLAVTGSFTRDNGRTA